MVETTTKNYGWTKPEITKSSATWGGFLNNDLDAIDALVFANQQGIVPIGAVAMFAGATAPANWMFCDGRSLDRTNPAYAALFGVIGATYGGSGNNFNLPNMAARFPLGAASGNPLATQGGSWTYTIAIANLPAHNHTASQDAHSHTAYQDAHSHGAYQDVHSHSDTGHVHGASVSQDAHSHGGVITGAQGGSVLQIGATATLTSGRTDTQQPAVHIAIATDYARLTNAQPAVHIDGQQPGVHVDTQQPAVYTANTGGGTALFIVPQYLAINFIIRYQ